MAQCDYVPVNLGKYYLSDLKEGRGLSVNMFQLNREHGFTRNDRYRANKI